MSTKFLLLLGVSGVGKSTLINELRVLDERFVYISPYITRTLRDGEVDKVHIDIETMEKMRQCGEFLVVNEKWGIHYATPIKPIVDALDNSLFPVLDWPVDCMSVMTENFAGRICSVYLFPPSMDELKKRLDCDGRDEDGARFVEAKKELEAVYSGCYDECFSLCLESKTGSTRSLAEGVLSHYMHSL